MTIDWWTLGFQTVNVAVLVWLLQRFFWRPVAAMIEQRRSVTARRSPSAARPRRTEAAARTGRDRDDAGGPSRQEHEAILHRRHAEAEKARTKATLDAAAKEAAGHTEAARAATRDRRA